MKLPKRNIFFKNKKIYFNRIYKNVQGLKPNGLWYSCKDAWYKWIIGEDMKEWLPEYIHQINIYRNIQISIGNKDINKLLVIDNIKDFDIFNKIYGTKYKDGLSYHKNYSPYLYNINWKKVSDDYGGIEICPFLIKRKNYSWYSTWDVASGCIWNMKSIIKNSKLIYKKKIKYIKVYS